MLPRKNFLQSKTIIGTLIVIVSMILPMFGVEFTAAEAQTLSQKIGLAIDHASEVVGLIMIVWGRWTADTPLTLGAGNRVNSPVWVVALAALLALSGCIGAGTFSADRTPLEKLRASYDAAVPLVTVYTALPSCGPDVSGLCSKPKVAKLLTDASDIVSAYLTQLEDAQDMSPEDKAVALRAAQNALRTMLTIYAVQALTKA